MFRDWHVKKNYMKKNHTDTLECRIRYKRLQVPVTVSLPGTSTVLHRSSEISFSERYSTIPVPVPISVYRISNHETEFSPWEGIHSRVNTCGQNKYPSRILIGQMVLFLRFWAVPRYLICNLCTKTLKVIEVWSRRKKIRKRKNQKKIMPHAKRTMGIDAVVSVLMKFVHPSAHIREKYPNP